ncbi:MULTISPECIES: hypothetical protein [Priestia]|nr:hypothetical protein [Priestia sp. AB]MDC0701393.1 hypothetical protein [Priestia sp. AB]
MQRISRSLYKSNAISTGISAAGHFTLWNVKPVLIDISKMLTPDKS